MNSIGEIYLAAVQLIKFAGLVVAWVGVGCLFRAFFRLQFGVSFENALMLVALGGLMGEPTSPYAILGVLAVLVWKFVRRRFFAETVSTEN